MASSERPLSAASPAHARGVSPLPWRLPRGVPRCPAQAPRWPVPYGDWLLLSGTPTVAARSAEGGPIF